MPTSTDPREILEAAIARSGLSVTALAEEMGRDRRTLSRWRSGESPIPPAALRWLTRLIRDDE